MTLTTKYNIGDIVYIKSLNTEHKAEKVKITKIFVKKVLEEPSHVYYQIAKIKENGTLSKYRTEWTERGLHPTPEIANNSL